MNPRQYGGPGTMPAPSQRAGGCEPLRGRLPSPADAATRVVKKLSPSSRGALKLAQRYGDALVCVRHRVDAAGDWRFTTVELLVETTLLRPRKPRVVGVRVAYQERDLQATVRAAGGRWDADAKLWRLPRKAAIELQLADRIVEEK